MDLRNAACLSPQGCDAPKPTASSVDGASQTQVPGTEVRGWPLGFGAGSTLRAWRIWPKQRARGAPGGHQEERLLHSCTQWGLILSRSPKLGPVAEKRRRCLPARTPASRRPHLALGPPGDPDGSWKPRLLGWIRVPAGAAGGSRGLHCSPDGLLFVTAGAAPCVHVLGLQGRPVGLLSRGTPGAGAFVPGDVAVTASGLVVVSDPVHGDCPCTPAHSPGPGGRWVTVGTFPSPRGLAVDAFSRLLVTDYVPGAVHSFTLGPAWEPLAPASMLGLEGPCWVGPGPDGGFAVSEEFGDVRLFGSARQPLGSLGDWTGHTFGCPAGICSNSEGNIIVADEQTRQVTLFPRSGPPICLVS
ncbi:NHL-repeat-containing protein 4 [Plecturocebus cupreus]